MRGSTDQAVFTKFPHRSDTNLCNRGSAYTLQNSHILNMKPMYEMYTRIPHQTDQLHALKLIFSCFIEFDGIENLPHPSSHSLSSSSECNQHKFNYFQCQATTTKTDHRISACFLAYKTVIGKLNILQWVGPCVKSIRLMLT